MAKRKVSKRAAARKSVPVHKRKRAGMINLATLRELAKRVYGKRATVAEFGLSDLFDPPGQGVRVGLDSAMRHSWTAHEDRATARRMMKAALEAAIK